MALPVIDPKETLEKILTIVNYEGDKDAFITSYLALCQQNTLIALLEDLSEEERTSLEQKLDAKTTPEEKQEVLKSQFSEEQLTEASYNETKKSFGEIMQKLLPTLDDNQKNQLKQYFESSTKSLQEELQ
jgi:Na+-translocating ferredoxin:NAD+ oxidoreductase RnfG subunit